MALAARLQHSEEQLSGATAEAAPIGTLTAMPNGSTMELYMMFLKMYDCKMQEYDAFRYEGAVEGSGEEIRGRWTVLGAWSGAFMMIRARWVVRI